MFLLNTQSTAIVQSGRNKVTTPRVGAYTSERTFISLSAACHGTEEELISEFLDLKVSSTEASPLGEEDEEEEQQQSVAATTSKRRRTTTIDSSNDIKKKNNNNNR